MTQRVVLGQGKGVSDTPAGSHPSVVKFLALCQCVFLSLDPCIAVV